MESNGRKVRGRCVVLTGPTLFCRPHRAPTGHTTTHPPRPMTRGPSARRCQAGPAAEGLTASRPDGTGRPVTIASATPYAAAVSVFEILNACGRLARNGGAGLPRNGRRFCLLSLFRLSCLFCQPRTRGRTRIQADKNVLDLVFLCHASTEYVLRSIIITSIMLCNFPPV